MKLTEVETKKLEQYFEEGALRIPSEPEHWIYGADGGFSYCLECCEKEVERLLKENPDEEYSVDGGWGAEGDSTPVCEDCGKLLENILTDYGCETEIDHFLQYGFDGTDDDRRAMSEVISARGWEPLSGREYENDRDKDDELSYFADLYGLCRKILDKHVTI